MHQIVTAIIPEESMIEGHATPEGTKRYADRFKGQVEDDFFIEIEGLTLSTLGLGTYLGEPNDSDDQALTQALTEAILGGVNVIDSAINYRAQRAERVIARVVTALIERGLISRDEIFVATKGGFIPFDGDYPENPEAFIKNEYVDTGVLRNEEIVNQCHSLAPKFISEQFERSRKNLNLETLDLYYLHNPETQLDTISWRAFLDRLQLAFVALEEKIANNELMFYGTATWNGYRANAGSKELLKLDEIYALARELGASSHFKFLQVPFNLAMPEALSVKNQNGKSVLQRASELGLHVMASASIMQGKILGHLPKEFEALAPDSPDSVKALNFVRSAPGLRVALCGMKTLDHVRENLSLGSVPKVNAQKLAKILSGGS